MKKNEHFSARTKNAFLDVHIHPKNAYGTTVKNGSNTESKLGRNLESFINTGMNTIYIYRGYLNS